MGRVTYRLLIVSVMIGLIIGPVLPGLAASGAKKELMVTSFETQDLVYAGQKAEYSVQVDSDDPNAPKASMKPYDMADVAVYFKNTDNKLIKSKPVSEKGGLYKGSVTLPDTGQWDVLVMALRKGEKEAADSSNVYTMTTQVAVHPPAGQGLTWILCIGLIIVVIFLFFFTRQIRRRNQKKG